MARRTTWEDEILNTSAVAGGATAPQLVSSLDADEAKGMTVTRVIGDLGFYSQTIAGAFGVMRVSFGIAVIDRDAAAAGAFPDPDSQADEPAAGWLYRGSRLVSQNGVGTAIVTNDRFDIRSQRRMGNGQLFYILQNITILGTSFTVNVGGLVRVLMLIP